VSDSSKVIPLSAAGKAALRKIRLLAADSENVPILPQFREWITEAGITPPQLCRTLRYGEVEIPPHLNSNGHWEVSLIYIDSGDEITLTAALDIDEETGRSIVALLKL